MQNLTYIDVKNAIKDIQENRKRMDSVKILFLQRYQNKMGWANYLYNDELDIAIEIGKINYDDLNENTWEALEEFIEYQEEPEHHEVVKNYLWGKCMMFNAMHGTISMFLDIYGRENWYILPEENLPKSAKKIMRH